MARACLPFINILKSIDKRIIKKIWNSALKEGKVLGKQKEAEIRRGETNLEHEEKKK